MPCPNRNTGKIAGKSGIQPMGWKGPSKVGYYMSGYRQRTGSGSRWTDLRYAGTCKVCGTKLPAGSRAYGDAGRRQCRSRCFSMTALNAASGTAATGAMRRRLGRRLRLPRRELRVLGSSNSPTIDRSQPLWTVKVGPLPPATSNVTRFPPPQTHTVTTAWFAGN